LTNLFINKIPLFFTEENLRELFGRFGNLRGTKLKKPDMQIQNPLLAATSTSYGIAFVNYASQEEAKAAMEGL